MIDCTIANATFMNTGGERLDHGGYGYAMSTVIETVLTYGGLTNESQNSGAVGY